MTLLHSQAGPAARRWLTRYVFGIWVAHFAFYAFEKLAYLPRAYYASSGLVYWLPDWTEAYSFDARLLLALRVIGIAACLACFSQRLLRFASVVACWIITLEQSYIRGFSMHMNHAEVNLMFAAYLFCLFAWADWLQDSRKTPSREFNRDGAPLATIAMVFTTTYFLVGMTRLYYGGVEIFTSDFLVPVTLQFTRQPWYIDFNLGEPLLRSPVLVMSTNFGLFAITLLEILAPLCLISRAYRFLFVLGMIGFHLLVLLFMKIPFFENVLLLVFLIDFGSAAQKKDSDANVVTQQPPDAAGDPAASRESRSEVLN